MKELEFKRDIQQSDEFKKKKKTVMFDHFLCQSHLNPYLFYLNNKIFLLTFKLQTI